MTCEICNKRPATVVFETDQPLKQSKKLNYVELNVCDKCLKKYASARIGSSLPAPGVLIKDMVGV